MKTFKEQEEYNEQRSEESKVRLAEYYDLADAATGGPEGENEKEEDFLKYAFLWYTELYGSAEDAEAAIQEMIKEEIAEDRLEALLIAMYG